MQLVSEDLSNESQRNTNLAQYNIGKTDIQFEQLANSVRVASYTELLKSQAHDKILSGAGDVGNIICASDLKISRALREIAGNIGFASFSEEDPGHFHNGVAERLAVSSLIEFDPVDGTGDRKYGERSTNSGKGFSTLAAVFEDYRLVAGICIRPAHNQQFIFSRNQGILKYEINPNSLEATRVFFSRNNNFTDTLRINFRPAYPNTNYSDSVLRRAEQISGYKFQQVETGGAGDALSRLVLGQLDIVISGKNRDWKTWDTDPFILALSQIPRGEITDYSEDLLERSPLFDNDLVHRNGVCASVADKAATKALLQAIREFEE